MPKIKKTLGILGGMGPLASEFFLRLVIERTKAACDGDHLDIIMSSVASTPDRTDFLTHKSAESPVPAMLSAIDLLVRGGAETIAVPCNTAAAFHGELQKRSSAEIPNIVEKTVGYAKFLGAGRVFVLATSGTVISGTYQSECRKRGMEALFPSEADQALISDEIYSKIKAGKRSVNEIYRIANAAASDCDVVLLGCTELSTIDFSLFHNGGRVIDSSRVLAAFSILRCGAEPVGFENIYSDFRRYYDKNF
ncbi:MAG: aspartate/glutamate racemase family protein [Clostridia bacterium]|nr:aspartate/glutamate racemase family protein [Clostridia bacterium]